MNERIFLLLFALIILMASTAAAQADREFVDKDRKFKITLVGAWQSVSYTDAVGRQKTEFVFGNRHDGVLAITHESLAGRSLADRVDNEMSDMGLRYACLFTNREAFRGGALRGIRATLHYLVEGRKVVGTYYYLQDGTAVWILRFTANPASPGIAADLTDRMARSFCPASPTP